MRGVARGGAGAARCGNAVSRGRAGSNRIEAVHEGRRAWADAGLFRGRGGGAMSYGIGAAFAGRGLRGADGRRGGGRGWREARSSTRCRRGRCHRFTPRWGRKPCATRRTRRVRGRWHDFPVTVGGARAAGGFRVPRALAAAKISGCVERADLPLGARAGWCGLRSCGRGARRVDGRPARSRCGFRARVDEERLSVVWQTSDRMGERDGGAKSGKDLLVKVDMDGQRRVRDGGGAARHAAELQRRTGGCDEPGVCGGLAGNCWAAAG